MEAVWAALIALASAVIVKILDWAFSRKDKTAATLETIKSEIASTKADIKSLREEFSEDKAIQCRQRILRFSDDLLHEQDHSKEYYDAVMQDITEYDYYSSQNPGFRNSVTGAAAKNILRCYQKHLDQKDFL